MAMFMGASPVQKNTHRSRDIMPPSSMVGDVKVPGTLPPDALQAMTPALKDRNESKVAPTLTPISADMADMTLAHAQKVKSVLPEVVSARRRFEGKNVPIVDGAADYMSAHHSKQKNASMYRPRDISPPPGIKDLSYKGGPDFMYETKTPAWKAEEEFKSYGTVEPISAPQADFMMAHTLKQKDVSAGTSQSATTGRFTDYSKITGYTYDPAKSVDMVFATRDKNKTPSSSRLGGKFVDYGTPAAGDDVVTAHAKKVSDMLKPYPAVAPRESDFSLEKLEAKEVA